jgi:hypothetical protein
MSGAFASLNAACSLHACVLVEEAEARLLVDPGGFSRGFEQFA